MVQPNQPLQYFADGGRNMPIGYGSLLLADANGAHLENPPPDPALAYVYVIYGDLMPEAPGGCRDARCPAIARARYVDLLDAAVAEDAVALASVFHKYFADTPDPWSEPGTSGAPDLSMPAGRYTPLWQPSSGDMAVLYDRAIDGYISVYQYAKGFAVRWSRDLVHWSDPLATYSEPGQYLYYPTLLGELADPTVGGASPRLAFTSFVDGSFPNYAQSVLEIMSLTLGTP